MVVGDHDRGQRVPRPPSGRRTRRPARCGDTPIQNTLDTGRAAERGHREQGRGQDKQRGLAQLVGDPPRERAHGQRRRRHQPRNEPANGQRRPQQHHVAGDHGIQQVGRELEHRFYEQQMHEPDVPQLVAAHGGCGLRRNRRAMPGCREQEAWLPGRTRRGVTRRGRRRGGGSRRRRGARSLRRAGNHRGRGARRGGGRGGAFDAGQVGSAFGAFGGALDVHLPAVRALDAVFREASAPHLTHFSATAGLIMPHAGQVFGVDAAAGLKHMSSFFLLLGRERHRHARGGGVRVRQVQGAPGHRQEAPSQSAYGMSNVALRSSSPSSRPARQAVRTLMTLARQWSWHARHCRSAPGDRRRSRSTP